jgi:predicted alpha/beta-fold hydrolase
VTPRRERIETPDGDFLDLDRGSAKGPTNRVAILSHGLQGCSRQTYVQGMSRALLRDGWYVIVLNFRGCSGEPNRLARSYHSGATEDLHAAVEHALTANAYDALALIGFSLGANLTLKYLGDAGPGVDPRIRGAVGISVPCDLQACAARLSHWDNTIYMHRFLRYLKAKTRIKAKLFPREVTIEGLDKIRNFLEFDGRYTAPLHGFESAEDYWRKCSCKPVLRNSAVPALILNARNDPFLPPECFPEQECADSQFVHLETPKDGGHMGFVQWRPDGSYWSEARAVEFLRIALQARPRDGIDLTPAK